MRKKEETQMDWNKTKTIFIVTFLILNVFLTWQLVETKSDNQLGLIAEATIQEQLQQNNITIAVDLPEEESSGGHVIGKSTTLTERMAANLFNQETKVIDNHLFLSLLNKPYKLEFNENFSSNLNEFLLTYVYKGDQYRYGRYEEETNKIYLYQKYGDKTAYTFEDEPLILQLNDQEEIVGYQQIYFEFEELDGKEREILSSLKALEMLLKERLIWTNDTITTIEFGYYSFFSPQGDAQVFAPMWRVVVDEDTFLVNAIEGTVQQLN